MNRGEQYAHLASLVATERTQQYQQGWNDAMAELVRAEKPWGNPNNKEVGGVVPDSGGDPVGGGHVGGFDVVVDDNVPPGQPYIMSDDMVNHPAHYIKSWGEVIDITEHFNFNLGNALKYIMRADDKGKPVEDLKKAVWYINRELQRREQ